jgi:hypothetical protein
MHGNVVMDLRDFQDTPHRMTSGIWNVGGGAYDPANPPELLNRTRRTINQPLNPWLEERERLLGPYRLPLHTQPDIHDKYRVQGNCVRNGVDCPLQPLHARPGGHIYTHPPDNGHRLPICQGKTVQLGRDNFLIPKAKSKGHIPTYQPLPYGTYETRRHLPRVALPHRGTARHSHRTPRHVGRPPRLQSPQLRHPPTLRHRRRHRLQPPPPRPLRARPRHDDCNDESVLVVPEPHALALARTLVARQRVRDTFDPTTCPTHDHPAPTRHLTPTSTDPPTG